MDSKSLQRAKEKMKIKDLKLKALLDVTNAINNNSTKEELFDIYEDVLRNNLNIGKLALYSHDISWKFPIHYEVDIAQLKKEDNLHQSTTHDSVILARIVNSCQKMGLRNN